MRPVDIRAHKVSGELEMLKVSFRKNHWFYFQEALGLGIFMISACLFSGLLFGEGGIFVSLFSAQLKQILLGLLMGGTALYIFYSKYTSGSGAHINPAVTITFFFLGKINKWDALFYILFQTAGGLLAVYVMALIMGKNLTDAPVHYVVTIPGSHGAEIAAFCEFLIALMMMSVILFTTAHPVLKKYTRVFAGLLVCLFVIFEGPVSGFGMNPARSFASAFPSHIWTAFWIYLFIPFAGMLSAAYIFRIVKGAHPLSV